MKKKLANLLFLAIMALPATAQITILAMDDVKKSEPIDELVFRAQYELKMVEDTTKADRQPNSETMMLEVGKKCSQFYSYTTYLRDSTLIADYANKVSQDVLQQHAKAYGNGRITYRIYKNYPTGKVTTLDRLATSNFRCEEKNEKPVWTLLPDTATILTYHCRKATGHFRGRSYTAWFTMEIPVSEGPWKLCGLPGLIIKAEDDRRHYSFECTGIEQFRGPKPLLFNGKGFESISRRDLNKVYERYAKDPVGFITSTAPNVKLTVKDEQGNTLKNFELPYNPIELSENNKMKTAIILSLLSFLLHIHTNAQNTIKGRVTDKVTRQPLESATVTLQQGGDGNIINYTLTDADGRFQLSSSSLKDRTITVFYMGYRKKTIPVLISRPLTIELEQEAVLLKEVQIRPGRVWGRQDTLKYDLTRFTSSKDRNVSDVLKKLPGINVEENGTIKYNGKVISNLYVEGMDVSGGRYNQINNNLKADAVQAAEVIEGHQPIKSLRGKTFTDDVALNLKLKPEVRSQWIYTVMAGGGYGEKALYDASFNVLQLSRNRQTVYTYKANNIGRNLFSDQQKLASGNSFDRVTDSNPPIFLPLPEPAIPLSQKRLLFNETHTASANRLYRLDEEKQLRFQLGYIHDRTTRQYGSEEIYYFAQDTVHTATNRHDRLKTDCLNGEVNYEDNAASRYTRENFSFAGTWKSGVSDITGDNVIFQKIKNSQWELKNYFNQLYTKEKYTWGIRSYIRYTHLPALLTVIHRNLPVSSADNRLIATCIHRRDELNLPDNINENTYRTVTGQTYESIPTEYEEMNIDNAYTDNALYGMRKKNGVNYQLTGGFRGELSSVRQENSYSAPRYSFYTIPRIEWERTDFLLTAAATVWWNRLPKQSYSRFYAAPSLYFRYKFSPRWKMSLSGSLDESEGGIQDIYPFHYREDYRTVVKHTGKVAVTVRQLYTCYLEYKNTVKEFFWTLSASYSHNRYNLMAERNYKDGNFYLSSVERNHSSYSYALNTIGSKGVYDWNLKTSLELTLARNEGKQLNENIVQNYRYDYLRVEPKIVWAPSALFEVEYKATVSCGGSGIGKDTRLDPLWDVAQRLTLSLGFHDTDFRLSGEHFYNDLSKDQHLNTWLADVSLIHKSGKWRFTASAMNLFNKEQYRYTLYSAVQSYTSWVKLRPREFMVSVQYQW